tara:strand:+ start:9319 stop:9516 length:198 start_codon:yes stop_codon:yes gene_type:complete
MPITQGAGNPVWSWDETLLALDILYRHDRPIDKGHDEVQQLSEVLRSALIEGGGSGPFFDLFHSK